MSPTFSKAMAAMVATTLFAGCGGGGAGSLSKSVPAVPSGPTTTYSGPNTNFAWGKDTFAKARFVSPIAKGSISMSVAVNLKNEIGLEQYAQDASNPRSPLYRQFLRPQDIANRFGASADDYKATADYFKSYGISVGGWPQRMQLSLAGGIPQFEKAFGTKFGTYRLGKSTFIGPVGSPHLSRAVPMTAVLNLAAIPLARSYFLRPSSSLFGGYSPQSIGKLFDFAGPHSIGIDGRGVTIGIVGTGPLSAADVPNLGATFNAPMAKVVQMPVSAQPAGSQNNNTGTAQFDVNPGGLTVAPPATGPCSQASLNNIDYTKCFPEDGEAQLDTEQAASLAPGATVDFYLAYNPSTCYSSSTNSLYAPPCAAGDGTYPEYGIYIPDDEIQQAIADNVVDDLSLSYGFGENQGVDAYYDANGHGLGPSEYAALAAEGIAVFASSGDTGNQSCPDLVNGGPLATPCVSYPATDPNVMAVGGVNAPADDAGNPLGTIAAWADQTTLGGDGSFQNNVGSGGGVSMVFAAPPWQSTITMPPATPASPQLNGKRGVPDMSLLADPATGPALVMNAAFAGHRLMGASGGTSAAAPEAAAMWALVLQACKESAACATAGGAHPYRLGNAAPLMYAIYNTRPGGTPSTGGFAPQVSYAQTFFDVLYGQNQANTSTGPITGCCTSGLGYDLVTGLGVPFGGHLIQAITSTKVP